VTTERQSSDLQSVKVTAGSSALPLRRLASSAVNRFLSRLGYAFVRIDGERQPTMFVREGERRYAYEHILVPDAFSPWALDDNFMALWAQVQSHTLVDIYRCYELHQLVREVAHVPGDILEVGVWRGGTGAMLAAAAARWKPTAAVWLCDTFEGVVKAGPHDPSYSGGEHSDTSRAIVEQLMSRMYLNNVTVIAGTFPDETGDTLKSNAIALCHIDVDVYQSAADIVGWACPRMERGAIMVFDDYGFSACKGITRLVDELRDNGDWQYIYNLNKHAILIRR